MSMTMWFEQEKLDSAQDEISDVIHNVFTSDGAEHAFKVVGRDLSMTKHEIQVHLDEVGELGGKADILSRLVEQLFITYQVAYIHRALDMAVLQVKKGG